MARYFVAFALTLIGLGYAVYAKLALNIGDLAFVSLVIVAVMVGVFVAYVESIKSINLAKGELILKDMKETESAVKEVARAVLEVTEASSHGLMLESYDANAKQKAVDKLRALTT